MERKLASVQRVVEIIPIEGADNIELAKVLGWQCVIKKGSFEAGDLGIYCEVDSFLPVSPEYEFLRKGCYRKFANGEEGFRIKTIKLRGKLSQGLLLPGEPFKDSQWLPVGTDVTEMLGIKKFEPPIPACLSGQVLGNFPGFIPKTDEIRIQAEPGVIAELMGKDVYITTKMDGSSMTVYKSGDHFGVCSRNLELKDTEGNSQWSLAKRYALDSNPLMEGIAIQGEIVGPGIQKNPLQLREVELFVFNVFDIKAGKYLNFHDATERVKLLGLKFVPVEYIGEFNFTLGALLEKASGKYPGTTNNKEGIVIRPVTEEWSAALNGRLSTKVINNDYLLKDEE